MGGVLQEAVSLFGRKKDSEVDIEYLRKRLRYILEMWGRRADNLYQETRGSADPSYRHEADGVDWCRKQIEHLVERCGLND